MNLRQAPAPKRKRRWLRRLGLTLAALVLLLALFHRPLVFRGTKYFAVRLAKEQKLDLSYDISGSLFTTLTLVHLRAKPIEPGPIERLEVGTLNLRYSLTGLLRKGLPGLLKDLDLRDVFVVVDPAKSVPREKPVQAQKGVKFPAVFPERLNLQNINFISRSPTGDTELTEFYFNLDPVKPGVLKIKTLNIPGVRRWDDIAAGATFHDRHLVLNDLNLGPEIALKRVNLDASKLESAEVAFGMEGVLFGAPTTFAAKVTDLNETNRLNVRAESAGLAVDSVSAYLNLKLPLHGTLARLEVAFDGVPERPNSWAGKIETGFDGLAFDQQSLGAIAAKIDLGNGRVTVAVSDQWDARNSVALHAEAALPEKLDGFSKTSGSGRLDVKAADLAMLTKGLPQTADGDLAVRVDFKIDAGQLTAKAALDSNQLAVAGANLTKTNFTIDVEKNIAARTQPVFAGLVTQTRGSIAGVQFGDYSAEGFAVALGSRGAAVALETLTLTRAANSVSVQGSYTLPDDLKSWESQPLAASVEIAAPDLSAFVNPGGTTKLAGELTIRGRAESVNRRHDGAFSIAGKGVSFNGLVVRDLGGDVSVVNSVAYLPNLGVYLDPKNFVNLGGEIALDPPMKYRAWIEAALADLSAFEPLLAEKKLGGALTVSWRGEGEVQPARHSGSGTLDLVRGKFNAQENLAAHLAAIYSPEKIDLSELRASSPQGTVQAVARWENKRLVVHDLAVHHGGRSVIEGAIDLPLDLAHTGDPARLFPEDEPLNISLVSRGLSLAWLFEQFGKKSPPKEAALTGTLDTTISAEGTIKNLVANVSLRASKVQSSAAAKLAPADLKLDLGFRDNRLKLDATVTQRDIKPLTIAGGMPLDLAALKNGKMPDGNTPIEFRMNLPRSPLGFVSTIVPAIRFVDGTAAIEVQAGGTIAKPELSGAMQADIPNLRWKDTSQSPVNSVVARIGFARDQITIQQFKGRLAGGSFGAGGTVNLARLTEPVFDLRINTREALVVQNDNVTARVTSDLRITGPLNAGTVSGSVLVTKSRFFKDIDILPIGLPGRPAPQPPAEPAPISFASPPLRDWKFDVAVKTADPFLIQGNLANGRTALDLKLAGTGLKPWLDGSVRIEQLMTSLPFSRLEITSGNIYFTAAKPFVPQLDIRGESTIRDYRVNVYISGDASNPQALFTSDPPLPQSEIVALIATGATTQELTGDPNALAGRAGLLVAQKLYRKIFKKNEPSQPKDTLFGNVQFDVGAPDPHSGQQSVQLRMPLGERLVLSGGVDVGGDFRGQLKYLVKFK